MSESEISQTHEGPVTEVPAAIARPRPRHHPSSDPSTTTDRGHQAGTGRRPRRGWCPSCRLPRWHPCRPGRPVPRAGVPARGRTTPLREESGDDDGPGDGKRTRSRRRSGRDRKSKQVGRYLVCVHVQPGMTQIAMLEGRSLVEHYVSRAADDTNQIDGNVYRGRVQNVLPGHGGRLRRHRHPEERRPLPGRRPLRPGRHRGRGRGILGLAAPD
jgi:hypothetical protein